MGGGGAIAGLLKCQRHWGLLSYKLWEHTTDLSAVGELAEVGMFGDPLGLGVQGRGNRAHVVCKRELVRDQRRHRPWPVRP